MSALDSLVGCSLVFGKKAKARCEARLAKQQEEKTKRVESRNDRKVANTQARNDRKVQNQESRDNRRLSKSEERTVRADQRQQTGNTFWDWALRAQDSAHGSAEKFWGVDGSGNAGALDGWFGMGGGSSEPASSNGSAAADATALDVPPVVLAAGAAVAAALVGVPLAVLAMR